jgi:hypothetical protein
MAVYGDYLWKYGPVMEKEGRDKPKESAARQRRD